MTNILRTSTEHKTSSLADERNSAYCQSSGAHNSKHINLWKLTLSGHLNTDVRAWQDLRKDYSWQNLRKKYMNKKKQT